MKKIVILVLGVIISTTAFSQETTEEKNEFRNNEFKVSVFDFFTGNFTISLEHLNKDNSSFVLNTGMTLVQNPNEEKIGGELELQYRYYLKPERNETPASYFDGVYMGTYLFYKYLDQTNTSTSYNGYYDTYGNYVDQSTSTTYNNLFSTYGGGVLIGVKFIIFERISTDFTFGGGIRYTDINLAEGAKKYDYATGYFSPGFTGIAPRAKLTVGLSF